MKNTHESEERRILTDREDVVIIVIDVQKKLLPAIHDGQIVLENTNKLLHVAGIMEIPVILTEQIKLGDTVDELNNLPRPIEKESFNCFLKDEFVNRLGEMNKSTIILTGIEAHICIAQTALYGLAEYNVHIVADAVSSRKKEDADLGIARCRQAGVTINSTEMVIYELLQKAGTVEFKKVLPLVK